MANYGTITFLLYIKNRISQDKISFTQFFYRIIYPISNNKHPHCHKTYNKCTGCLGQFSKLYLPARKTCGIEPVKSFNVIIKGFIIIFINIFFASYGLRYIFYHLPRGIAQRCRPIEYRCYKCVLHVIKQKL